MQSVKPIVVPYWDFPEATYLRILAKIKLA